MDLLSGNISTNSRAKGNLGRYFALSSHIVGILGALFLHYFGFQYCYGTLSYFSVILRYLFLTPGAQKSTATGVACYRDENRLCNSLWHRRAEQWLWKLTCMVGEGNDEVSIGFILAYPH